MILSRMIRLSCKSLLLLIFLKHCCTSQFYFEYSLKPTVYYLTIMTSQAGNHVLDDAVPRLIHLISASESMHSYAVHHLYKALKLADDLNIQPLSKVSANYILDINRIIRFNELCFKTKIYNVN